MAMTTKDLWRLLVASRLRSAAECQKLAARYQEATANGDDAAKLAEWLVAERLITRYHAKVLLSGRPGPFVYGDYIVRERVSSGRLSGLFRAVHLATRHPVLLQFLSGPLVQDARAYASAITQLGAACQVVHPCLSQVDQVVDLGTFKFVVLEDLSGASAEEVRAGKKRMAPPDACRTMRHVAMGLATLHAAGQVHGELRPANVWIDRDGNGRLLHLPLSREPHLLASSLAAPLSTERLLLAADYFAPELAYAGAQPDVLTDVYAFGCTLYELLSGKAPFDDGDVAQKMQRHAAEAIQPLEQFGVPEALAQVVAYAMAKDRSVRYPSAAQLAEALGYFVEPAKLEIYPKPAATYPAYDAWRRTQKLVAGPPAAAYVAVAAAPVPVAPSFPMPHPAAGIPNAPAGDGYGVPGPGFAGAASGGPSVAGVHADSFVAPVGATISATEALVRRRRRARNQALATLAVVLVASLAAWITYENYIRPDQPSVAQGEDESENGDATRASNGEPDQKSDDASATPIIPDDGKTLWASPTDGQPLSLAYLPATAQVVVALRPAELLAHPEGEKLLAALGPKGEQARTTIEAATGMKLKEIEQLLIGWSGAEAQWAPTYVVRPAATTTIESLTAKWRGAQEQQQGNETFYVLDGRAYYVPTAEQGRAFVIASAAQMQDVFSLSAASGPLSRDLARLTAVSDSDRLFSLLFTTGAMLDDGHELFAAANFSRLHQALQWFLGNNVKAAGVSLHLADDCYLEARLVGSLEASVQDLTEQIRRRLQELPTAVEAYLATIDLGKHARLILLRLPQMLRFAQEYVRVEANEQQTVINCYLPAIAAHNLVMAAELAIAEQGNGGALATNVTPTGKAVDDSGPQTIAEKLKKRISVVTTLNPLDATLKLVAGEIDVGIEILGKDLETEGITRNQQFSLDERDKPADEVLRAIMLKANPDGKLVYVIKPKQPGGPEMIFITTRAAAAKRGDKLLPE